MSAPRRCLNPNCAEYAVRLGYGYAISDLCLILADLITLENKELIKEIQARMEHNESIRIETDFSPPLEA